MSQSSLPDPTYDPEFYQGVLFKRLLAWVVDTCLIVTIMIVLGLLTFTLVFWLWVPVHLALAFLYRWYMLSNYSATLGMQLMSIELRAANGARLKSKEAALHTITFLLAWMTAIVQVASIAMMALRADGRGLSDILLGTSMINRPA